jgi:hypothetical protein
MTEHNPITCGVDDCPFQLTEAQTVQALKEADDVWCDVIEHADPNELHLTAVELETAIKKYLTVLHTLKRQQGAAYFKIDDLETRYIKITRRMRRLQQTLAHVD